MTDAISLIHTFRFGEFGWHFPFHQMLLSKPLRVISNQVVTQLNTRNTRGLTLPRNIKDTRG